jgi:sirohydrochlorin ferrochelatase
MNNHSHSVLIIMAHGSRKIEANEEFAQLVEQIAAISTEYALVTHCFLEIATPSLEDCINEYVALGYQHYDLYPLFFNQGNHVTRDIPQQIQDAQQQHPSCHIQQLNYFGLFGGLAHSVHQHIQHQTEP